MRVIAASIRTTRTTTLIEMQVDFDFTLTAAMHDDFISAIGADDQNLSVRVFDCELCALCAQLWNGGV